MTPHCFIAFTADTRRRAQRQPHARAPVRCFSMSACRHHMATWPAYCACAACLTHVLVKISHPARATRSPGLGHVWGSSHFESLRICGAALKKGLRDLRSATVCGLTATRPKRPDYETPSGSLWISGPLSAALLRAAKLRMPLPSSEYALRALRAAKFPWPVDLWRIACTSNPLVPHAHMHTMAAPVTVNLCFESCCRRRRKVTGVCMSLPADSRLLSDTVDDLWPVACCRGTDCSDAKGVPRARSSHRRRAAIICTV